MAGKPRINIDNEYLVKKDTVCYFSPHSDPHEWFLPRINLKFKLKTGEVIKFIEKDIIKRYKPKKKKKVHLGYYYLAYFPEANIKLYVSDKDIGRAHFKEILTLKERRERNKYIYDLLQNSPELASAKRADDKYGHSFHGRFTIREAILGHPLPENSGKEVRKVKEGYKNWRVTFRKLIRKYFNLTSKKLAVDLGCGGNQFINQLRENNLKGIGVDISNPAADVIAPMHATTLKNNTADLITAFDVMEHLEPDEVEEVLIEIKRIAKLKCNFIFTIATWRAFRKVNIDEEYMDVYQLHPTIKSEKWWKYKLEKNKFKINRWELHIAQGRVEDDNKKLEIRVWGNINHQSTI